MLIHEPLGVSRAIFLALPAEPRSVQEERACGDPAEQGGQRRGKLVGVNPRGCQWGREAVSAAKCKPAKGRSQSS